MDGFISFNHGIQNPFSPSPVERLVSGLLVPGNIDIHNRPIVKNPDGTISTVRTITVTDDQGRAINIPTVVGGRVVSNDAAVRHYQMTGQHLGIYTSEAKALKAAQQLHEEQAGEYGGGGTLKLKQQ